jgi:hypothetical protein
MKSPSLRSAEIISQRTQLFLVAAILSLTILGVHFLKRDSSDQSNPSNLRLLSITTQARPRIPSKDVPFWNSAIVPEPKNFREPSSVDLLQSKLPLVNHPSDVAALNFALAAWFDADPAAARDWLARLDSLDLYQPALTMIVGKIAQAGDLAHALAWAALLTPGPEQEQSLFDIYALAARNHRFSEAELRAAPLPPARIDELLSGAAGD